MKSFPFFSVWHNRFRKYNRKVFNKPRINIFGIFIVTLIYKE